MTYTPALTRISCAEPEKTLLAFLPSSEFFGLVGKLEDSLLCCPVDGVFRIGAVLLTLACLDIGEQLDSKVISNQFSVISNQ
jgi:hypothetical protein